MHLLLGTSRMESGDYKDAIQVFERARAYTRYRTNRGLSVISLVSFLWLSCNVSRPLPTVDRYLDGSLTILTSRSDSVFAKHCMPLVA